MQPNGTPHALALHPISSIIHEGAAETARKITLIGERYQTTTWHWALFTFKIISGGIQLISNSYTFPLT